MTQEAAVPASWRGQIQKWIDQAVAKALRSAPQRNSSIGDGGSFMVKGGLFAVLYRAEDGGAAAVTVGDQYAGALYQGTGLLVQAPDGTDMIVARQDLAFAKTRIDILDSGGRIIFGNDAYTGQGMARPYIGAAFNRTRYADMSVSTTSATFETLWDAWLPKQHPRLEVAYRATMDTAATTGEVRVMVDDEQLGATTSEAFAVTTRYAGPLHVGGEHMAWMHVEIQGRRTSATGALRVEPMYLIGRQS